MRKHGSDRCFHSHRNSALVPVQDIENSHVETSESKSKQSVTTQSTILRIFSTEPCWEHRQNRKVSVERRVIEGICTFWNPSQAIIKSNSSSKDISFITSIPLVSEFTTNLLPHRMRRVSSRQRLVSWDAFDATAGSDSEGVNKSSFASYKNDFDGDSYSSACDAAPRKPSSLSSDLGGLAEENADSHKKGTKLWTKRRKRDRKSSRSHGTERMKMCKHVEIPQASPVFNPPLIDIPTLVPSFSWETGKSAGSKILYFDNLIDDIHLGIFSFLDLPSLRSVMSVNHRYRNLLIFGDAKYFVWMDHCERILHIKRKSRTGPPLRFVDDLNLPTAAAATIDERNEPNFSFLLNLAPTNFPTSIDKVSLTPRARLRRSIQQTIPSYRLEDEDQLIRCYQESSTDRLMIQYTGHVGQGDRCIRSNNPFPKPKIPILKTASDTSSRNNVTTSVAEFLRTNYQHQDSCRPSLLDILRSGSKSMIRDNSKLAITAAAALQPPLGMSPFVVPFTSKSSYGITTVNITPRFVSYFEVNILKVDEKSSHEMTLASRRPRTHRTSYKDCVAVGVATKTFQFQSRMPGWDKQSYGYHGDDGGIFHASGGMLKQFGPKFGPGDTVGCGIDYVSRGIFYTLNGRFLGYAWERISDDVLEKDLFPVVGIDTNSPIHMNFGSVESGPFQFDLSNFLKKHEKRISSLYSLDAFLGSETNTVTTSEASSKYSTKKASFALSSSTRQRRSLVGRRSQRER